MKRKEKELPEEFAEPQDLTPLGAIARNAVVALLRKDDALFAGGCTAFYSPKQWKERGEEYGTDDHAVLICVHDGGELGSYFNYDHEQYKRIERMNAALAKVGCYAEPATCWYTVVYPY